MKLLKLLYQRETVAPMLALTFASGASVSVVLARIAWTGHLRYAFLIWNLLLAWLPLVFAVLACEQYRNGAKRNWRFFGLATAWLLFFPNAPYILTDVIHLMYGPHRHFWVDLTLILLCALTGLVLGFVSLFLMQSVVMRLLGRAVSWFFIAGVAGLSGFGIYLGRCLRWNSWDILLNPFALARDVGDWAAHPFASATSGAFPVLFATFLFVVYLMLYGLTHLRPTLAANFPNETTQGIEDDAA